MEQQLIRQFGQEILSYRLRTARQKKRLQRGDLEKQLRELSRRQKRLTQQQRNLGYQPLVPPYQRGWNRSFVLRPDVARSKQAAFFQGILDKINTTIWSHKKDFFVKKRKLGRKYYVVRAQELKKMYADEFDKLKFTDTEKALFHLEYYVARWHGYRDQLIARYVFSEPWRFVLKVQPNMIEKIKVADVGLESELQEIHNYLERNNYEPQLYRLVDGSYHRREHRVNEKEQYRFKNMSVLEIIGATKEELL